MLYAAPRWSKDHLDVVCAGPDLIDQSPRCGHRAEHGAPHPGLADGRRPVSPADPSPPRRHLLRVTVILAHGKYSPSETLGTTCPSRARDAGQSCTLWVLQGPSAPSLAYRNASVAFGSKHWQVRRCSARLRQWSRMLPNGRRGPRGTAHEQHALRTGNFDHRLGWCRLRDAPLLLRILTSRSGFV